MRCLITLSTMLLTTLIGATELYAQSLCVITQITITDDPFFVRNITPSINSDGTAIALRSGQNFTGNNTDGNEEIFLYQSGVGITQITDSINAVIIINSSSINSDGTAIVFLSNGNLTGNNADQNHEIFLYQSGAGITQITNSISNVFNSRPSINGDGTAIAFLSSGNLTGTNADENFEIFLYQSGIGITQITNSTGGGSVNPSISSDGTAIAFRSGQNFTGTNADENQEIFLYQSGAGITQITNSMGGINFAPSINSDGTAIAFQSDRNLTGTNADENLEIFLYQSGAGITQITDSIGGINDDPSISSDGTAIAFQSDRDLTGNNADENHEIFLYQSGVGITQITDSIGGLKVDDAASINSDGTAIAFHSDRDLTGNNADENREIFLSDCGTINISVEIGPNSINPRSKAMIPVAILTTEDFDAITVDPMSVVFGPSEAAVAHGKGHIEDVDDDGDDDLVFHFRTQETGILCGDTSATLTGETFDGQVIEGSAAIKTVGCK